MIKYVLLAGIGMSGFIAEASQSQAPLRHLKTDAEVQYVKDLVRAQGPEAFVDALTGREFDEEIYELQLDDFKVQVNGAEESLADILLGLNNMDYTFNLIQTAFFSKERGQAYLKGRLTGLRNLQEMNQFLQEYPWAFYYVNPFKVLTDHYSLGYYVEIGLLTQDASACAIKDLYGNRWDAQFKLQMSEAEKALLEIEQIKATIINLYNLGRIARVIDGLQRDPLKDAVAKVDLGAITVKVSGVDCSLLWLIKDQAKAGDKGAQDIYARHVMSNVNAFSKLLADAHQSGNYKSVADEIDVSPSLARNLFRAEIMLDLQIDDLAATGNPDAQRIKAAVPQAQWDTYRARYKDARHLRICWNNGTIDDEGRQILANPGKDVMVTNYVTRLEGLLKQQINGALQGQDLSKVDRVGYWVDEFVTAGIDFSQGEKIAVVQNKLNQHKIALGALKGTNNGGGNPPVKKTFWLTPTKLFLIGVGCVVAYVAFDQLKKYSDEDQPAQRPDHARDLVFAH